jgi:hypothetical protein
MHNMIYFNAHRAVHSDDSQAKSTVCRRCCLDDVRSTYSINKQMGSELP